MSLDTRTIIALLVIGNIAFPILLLAYRRSASTDRRYGGFILAKALQAPAWTLLLLRDSIPDLASLYLGNTLLFFGFALEIATLAAADWADRLWGRLPLIVAGLGSIFFCALARRLEARVFAASLVMAAIFIVAAIELLRPPRKSRLRIAMASLYGLIAAGFIARSVAGLRAPSLTLFSNASQQIATFLLLYFLMLVGWIAFLLLLRERAEGRLAVSEAKYRSLIELASEAILIVQDLSIVYANEGSGRLFGLPRESLVGRPIMDLIDPADREAVMSRIRLREPKSQEVDRFDLRIQDGSGRLKWVFLSANRIEYEETAAILAVLTDISDRKRDEERIKQLARQLEAERNRAELVSVTDGLTGLNNRRLFDDRIVREFYRLKRSGSPLSLIMLDIDHFKLYNDRLGHQAGDDCLRRIAAMISDTLKRPGDCAARYGGEEFVVILPETERAGAAAQAERIRAAVEGLGLPHPAGGPVTISLGVVTALPSIMGVPERIVELADQALYRAKAGGRNRVETSVPGIEEADLSDGLVRLTWRAADESGDRVIDAEHKELLEAANRLIGAAQEGAGKERVSSALAGFLSLVARHFVDEERILAEAAYPELPSHIRSHAALLAAMEAKVGLYRNDRIGLVELISFIAYEVVLQHMHTEDREFFRLLRARSDSSSE